jgi:hypothetical protein
VRGRIDSPAAPDHDPLGDVVREETTMRKTGAVFQPERIELMGSLPEAAATGIPREQRTPAPSRDYNLARSYSRLKHLRAKVEHAEGRMQVQKERVPADSDSLQR